MINKPTCDLYILTAATDFSFIRYTIPHQLKSCKITSGTRHLLVDTAKISGHYAKNREINPLDEVLSIANDFLQRGIIDEISPISYKSKEKKYLAVFIIKI